MSQCAARYDLIPSCPVLESVSYLAVVSGGVGWYPVGLQKCLQLLVAGRIQL